MDGRLGSGIEPPDWMQQLAREFDRAYDEKIGLTAEPPGNGEFQRVTQKDIDKQLARMAGEDA